MSTEEIKLKLEDIRAAAESGDSEKAHSMEDALLVAFVEYVGTLPLHSLSTKAKLVLFTKTIDFERWCA